MDLIPLKPEEACIHAFGVISPKGEFFPCNYMGHRDLVCELYEAGYFKNDDYDQIEENGWIKYSDMRDNEKMKYEFHFAFITNVRFERPAKEGEKSFLIVNGINMVYDSYDVGHIPTKEQIEFLSKFKKYQENGETITFNSNTWEIEEFVEKIEKEIVDFEKYFIKENIKYEKS